MPSRTTKDMLVNAIIDYKEENGNKPEKIVVFGNIDNFISKTEKFKLPEEVLSDTNDDNRPKQIFGVEVSYKDYQQFDECMVRLV